jgi:hypothetical protein
LTAPIGHSPKIFEVIQDRLDMNGAAVRDTEPDSAASLDSKALSQFLGQGYLPLGGNCSFNGSSGFERG